MVKKETCGCMRHCTGEVKRQDKKEDEGGKVSVSDRKHTERQEKETLGVKTLPMSNGRREET